MRKADPPSAPGPYGLALAAALLLLSFARPLLAWVRVALESGMDSYLLIVPALAAGLAWVRYPALPPRSAPNRTFAAASIGAGAAVMAGATLAGRALGSAALSAEILAFVLCLVGICAWWLGRQTLRTLAFPICFLLFMIPIPGLFSARIEYLLDRASAAAANLFFEISGFPVLRLGDLSFRIPGITLEVAPECSGLRSSLSLLLVGLMAGFVFLRTPWRRAVLVLAVVPLGIIRNGFRIFTIAELCVHFGPRMIDSYLHRHGGWIFFLVSLGPFFLLLFYLLRSETPEAAPAGKPTRT